MIPDTLPKLKQELASAQADEIRASTQVAIAKQQLQQATAKARSLSRRILNIERNRIEQPHPLS